jgi:O-antigen ligase
MPLDRVTNLATRPPYPSLIALVLLLQRGLVLLWDRGRGRQGSWPKPGLAAAFLLPAVAAGVTTVAAYNGDVAMAAAVLLCFVLVRGWVLAQYVREPELTRFEDIVLWVTIAVVGFGYYQYVADVFGLSQSWTFLKPMYSSAGAYPFPRVQSFALEPLYLAHYLFLPIGILLVRFVRRQKASLFEKIVLVVTLALFMVSLSRGAMLGLLLAITATLVVVRSWKLLKYLAKIAVPAVLIVVAMLLLAGAVREANTAGRPSTAATAGTPNLTEKTDPVDAFTSHAVDLNDGSARNRYDLWPRTIDMFLEHPVTGVGLNNSRLLLHGGSNTASTAEANALQPVNNDFLAFLSEMGLVGLVLALPLIWLMLRALWGVVRARLDHPSGPYAFALVGMAVEANAFHSLLLLRTWVVIGLLVAGARLASERQEPQQLASPPAVDWERVDGAVQR